MPIIIHPWPHLPSGLDTLLHLDALYTTHIRTRAAFGFFAGSLLVWFNFDTIHCCHASAPAPGRQNP